MGSNTKMQKKQNSQPGALGIIETPCSPGLTPCSPGLDLWMGSKLTHLFVERGLEIRGRRTESQVCYGLPSGDRDKDVQWESKGRTQPSSWLSVPSVFSSSSPLGPLQPCSQALESGMRGHPA